MPVGSVHKVNYVTDHANHSNQRGVSARLAAMRRKAEGRANE